MKYIYKGQFTSIILYVEILWIINCGLIQLVVMGEYFSQCAHITYAVTLRKNITLLRLTGMHYLKYYVIIARGVFRREVPRRIAKLFVPAYWIYRVPIYGHLENTWENTKR